MSEYQNPICKVLDALDGPHGDTASLYAQIMQLRDSASFPPEDDFLKAVADRTRDGLQKAGRGVPVLAVREAFFQVEAALVISEGITRPPSPLLPIAAGTVEEGRYRDYLLSLIPKYRDPVRTIRAAAECFASMFLGLSDQLPGIAFLEESVERSEGLKVDLVDIIPVVAEAIEQLIIPFFAKEMRELNLYPDVRKTLIDNIDKVSGKSEEQVFPTESKLPPKDLVREYLKDTPLTKVFDTQIVRRQVIWNR